MHPSGLHDVELAGLAAAGDRPAYGELVRRHAPAIRGLLRRMGAQPAAADDVAQDAFLIGFEQMGDFRGSGSFAGWIRAIATRLYLRRLRREAQIRWDDIPEFSDPAALDEPRTASRIDLDEALAALATPERLCVSLCYGAEMSHAEAADALKIPLGTVKSHVKRGLEKLRLRMVSTDNGDAKRRPGHG